MGKAFEENFMGTVGGYKRQEDVNAFLDGNKANTSKFGTIHYYDDTDIVKWSDNGLTISNVYGIRTFWDLQHNQDMQNNADWQKNMMQIEMRVS